LYGLARKAAVSEFQAIAILPLRAWFRWPQGTTVPHEAAGSQSFTGRSSPYVPFPLDLDLVQTKPLQKAHQRLMPFRHRQPSAHTTSLPSQLCACQTIQTHALLRGLHGQRSVYQRRDAHPEFAAILSFSQWHGDGLAI
jgi:hypothetical protein